MTRILIIGATSAIATSWARLWTRKETAFYLVGRNSSKLDQTAADLVARGAGDAYTHTIDMNDLAAHGAMLEKCSEVLKTIDIALIAHGTLPDQQACERDVDTTIAEVSNNCISVIAILTNLANRFETQGSGTIAVISSVAGDRGRPSNYVYGSAKSAVSTFCEGLNARLHKSGVHVLTIKPGFVDTPMTQGLSLPKLLVASPEKVAIGIQRAINRQSNVVYVPWFWRYIMLVIKSIPPFLFKRLDL